MIIEAGVKQARREAPFLAAVCLFAGMFFMVIPAGWDNLTESRSYRDLLGMSAIKNVQVTRAIISDDNRSMTVWGEITKLRCEKRKGSEVATTQDAYGDWHYAEFSASAQSKSTPDNRPPLGEPDVFGPWTITSAIENPVRAQFWVSHDQCPRKLTPVLVFDIEWKATN